MMLNRALSVFAGTVCAGDRTYRDQFAPEPSLHQRPPGNHPASAISPSSVVPVRVWLEQLPTVVVDHHGGRLALCRRGPLGWVQLRHGGS